VIMELASIIAEPLKLPEWFLPMVIVLLCIGFIIATILSWIYDIKPEGGIVKTEPAHRAKAEDQPASSNSWKIASYISFLVIVAFIVFSLVGNNKKSFDISKLERSIAVLPLKYLSADPDKEYLANGVLDAITGHLSTIEGLRVMPRTSVEQYRETTKSAKEIGEELDVIYLIEGSFLMMEDQVKLTIQLVVANAGDHVFFKEYDRDYKDIFIVQSEVAQTIAKEIEVAITPVEKQLIEKIPTPSLTAYDLYQRGREEYVRATIIYQQDHGLENAENYFNQALEHDPEFALAYAGLAMVHYYKYFTGSPSGGRYSVDYFNSEDLQLMNKFAQKALFSDDQLTDAYFVKAMYEQQVGNSEEALVLITRALEINPNHIQALIGSSLIYLSEYDFVNAFSNMHKAASLEHGVLLPMIYINLFMGYLWYVGDYDIAPLYLEKYLSLTGDSMNYFLYRYVGEYQFGNQQAAIDYARAAYMLDSSYDEAIMYMGKAHYDAGRYQVAHRYYSRYYKQLEKKGILDINDMNRMGHIMWMVGEKDSAMYFFSQMIDHCKRHLETGTNYGREAASYDLAGVYAFLGEKDSAYHYLEVFSRSNSPDGYFLDYLGHFDPLYESIRGEEQFQIIFKQIESKFEAEQERVRQWLLENDLF